MLEATWYIAVAVGALVVISNWRAGIYVGILADCLRDPVRKLDPSEPILITLTGSALWVLLVIVALIQEKQEIALLAQRYPRIKTVIGCLIVALVPAAALSCLLYNGGWQLALVGMASYVGPILGLAVGYAFAQTERDVYRMLAFYSVVNSFLLIGVPLEYFGADVAGLED
jgi:EamA domain-containing membrane protein RarD